MFDRMPSASWTDCEICGGPAELICEERNVVIKNREARVLEEFWRCDTCEEEYMTPEQMRSGQDRAVRAIREAEGLLQADEIRSLRETHGLTQRALEKLLGVGPKTVVRWENGTVFQSRAVDTLLRVLRQTPDALRGLARERGVELEARRYWAVGNSDWAGGAEDLWRDFSGSLNEMEQNFKPVEGAWTDGDGRAEDLVKSA